MEVFFYGLFMDTSILLKNGIVSSNPRISHLPDYALEIGNRASLVPVKGSNSYGLLMTCDEADIRKLYSELSVIDYVPEQVTVFVGSKEPVQATCYNLPPALLTGTNTTYANSLYQLARKIGFPKDYLAHIKTMTS